MPIFEYYCSDNHTVYRFFARRAGLEKKVPRCPVDPGLKLEKRVSSFAIVGRTPKAKKDQPGGDERAGKDDPRTEQAMMELERDLSGMDEENPDPRQLGRLMRRMSELTVEKSDARMEEMIRRLESGEDLEKMEEEYGDDLGEELEPGAEPAAANEDEGLTRMGRILAQIRRARRRSEPRIDPEIYEMEDFLRRRRSGS